jgi:iron complex transport system substrate-binding protein|tara:strand:- start:1619 stop:2506 length:888 start_codon:yes stop_codon:yes gene_type:complete
MLVGRSHECNWPKEITNLPILTGQKTAFTSAAQTDAQVSSMLASGESLYTIDETLIESLRPDLILTQDICSVCAIDLPSVERLAGRIHKTQGVSPQILSLNPQGLQDVLDDVVRVGEAVGLQREAELTKNDLLRRRVEVEGAEKPAAPPSVAFIEWPAPLYIGGHWTPKMIEIAGGSHPLNPSMVRVDGAGKSFPVTHEQLAYSDPDVIIISPCGLNLEEAEQEASALLQQDWFQGLRAVREGRLFVVDGDAMFNRPGPRLVDALEWLHTILQPQSASASAKKTAANFPYKRLAW